MSNLGDDDVPAVIESRHTLERLHGEQLLVGRTLRGFPALGAGLRGADLAQRDIFLILENDYGITLGHADLRIDAVAADAALAAALQVREGSAILRIEPAN